MTQAEQAPTLSKFDGWLGSVETIFNLIAAFSILFLMFFGVCNIVGRTLGFPIWGYVDFVEQAIAIFAFMGIAYCQRAGGHVRMDLALRGLKGRSLWTVEFLAILLSLIVVGILVYNGYTHFDRAFTKGDSTIDADLPVWPSKLIVPVALGLLWLRLLLQLFGFLRLIGNPNAEPIAVPTIPTIEDVARHEIDDTGNDGADDQPGRAPS